MVCMSQVSRRSACPHSKTRISHRSDKAQKEISGGGGTWLPSTLSWGTWFVNPLSARAPALFSEVSGLYTQSPICHMTDYTEQSKQRSQQLLSSNAGNA